MELVNIGYGGLVAASRIIAVVSPDSAPIKRLVSEARERSMLIDATFGRKTRAVLLMDSDHVVLSGIALEKLAGERRDLALLRPLVLLLLGWSLLDWLFAWAGRSLEGQILFLDLLTAAAGLYFHYQFLTDMAALAERYQDPEDNLDRRLRRRRTQYLVLVTAIQLTVTLAGNWRQEWQIWLAMGMAVAGCVVAVLIMAALFALRRYFMPGEQPQDDSSH